MVDITKIAVGIIGVIISIIIIFQLVAGTANDLQGAAGNISSSGLPLAGLFSGNGIIMLVFMAGILISVVYMALKMHKN